MKRKLIVAILLISMPIAACGNKTSVDEPTFREFSTETSTETSTNEAPTAASSTSSATAVTLTAFIDTFSTSLGDVLNIDNYALSDLTESENENGNGVYSASVSGNVGVVFLTQAMSKDSKLRSVTLTQEGGADENERVLFLTCMNTIIKTIDPSISDDDLIDITVNLPMDTATGGTAEKTINGITYTMIDLQESGRVFTFNIQ